MSVCAALRLSRQNLPLLLGRMPGSTDHQVQAGCCQNHTAGYDAVPELSHSHQDESTREHAQNEHADQAAEDRPTATEQTNSADDYACDHLQLETAAAVERRIG